MKTDNFFIFDLQGHIVGNPKGYATHKGASIQANNDNSPARKAIQAAYIANGGKTGGRHLWAIATIETAIAKRYTKAATN